ncbi:hypothetical protein [Amycolatopsis xylanica]|uniref:hypothetical protein n=1 Tax=Amycolatopsis xylanica TaxID=589385 RepID=UPI000B89B5C1|nr:hypothetical protein [Amycolatopsis xylanica]
MKIKPALLFVAGVAAVAVVGVGGAVLTGFPAGLQGHQYAIPACDQLPSRAQVTQAIADHARLYDQLVQAGSGVEVVAGRPCPDPDKSVVAVRVISSGEESAANDILGKATGFGVPATIETR